MVTDQRGIIKRHVSTVLHPTRPVQFCSLADFGVRERVGYVPRSGGACRCVRFSDKFIHLSQAGRAGECIMAGWWVMPPWYA